MYFAIENLITRDLQGYEITRYRKGDAISNWGYFWMKKRYKKKFVKAKLFVSLPEEEYRREVQERDSDISNTEWRRQQMLITQQSSDVVSNEWYPHDDHMLITHRRTILDEGIPLGQPMDDIPLVNPTEQWQDAVTPQIDMDTTIFDDPAQQEPMYGSPPSNDSTDYTSPIQDSSNDNSYDSSSDYSSSSPDSSYDSDSSSDYSSSDSSNDN